MMKKIAIIIQNYVQFYSIKPFIDLSDIYAIDLFVPIAFDDSGFTEMFNDIYNFLVQKGYKVYREVDTTIKYKILLEPYPMDIFFKFNYEYRIKYKYASVSAKPKITYNIPESIVYDAILCHSTYEQEILNNFTKTFLVGRLCFKDFRKKHSNKKRKTILYLPTYGVFNCIDETIGELKKISDKYDIITKEHHGTNYLYSESDRSEKLKGVINKFYDSSYPLSKLLEISDVILTDNSGSIFESLYTNVPVCIFSKNIKDCNFNTLESLQYQLVKDGVIPFTDNPKKIKEIIDKSLTMELIEKQKNASMNLFPIDNNNIMKSFTDVIDSFLNEDDKVLNNRIILHREVQKYFNSIINENNNLVNKNSDLLNDNRELSESLANIQIENQILNNRIEEYEKGKLYRISTKIYSFKTKIRRKIKNEKI